MTRSELFEKLRSRGIKRIEVCFSGGNDEGGVDDIIADGEYFNRGEVGSENWELTKALCEPVYDKYCSFAGEFYVDGKVIYDVEKETITMTGSEEVPSYESFNEEL